MYAYCASSSWKVTWGRGCGLPLPFAQKVSVYMRSWSVTRNAGSESNACQLFWKSSVTVISKPYLPVCAAAVDERSAVILPVVMPVARTVCTPPGPPSPSSQSKVLGGGGGEGGGGDMTSSSYSSMSSKAKSATLSPMRNAIWIS